MLLESAFHYLFCLKFSKFSFKLITFTKSYARNQKWMFFFLNTVYLSRVMTLCGICHLVRCREIRYVVICGVDSYVEHYACSNATDLWKLINARKSFPSGHSSMSAYVAVYLLVTLFFIDIAQ